jgi:raffinose/stachyose/melibiose transport system permease protein
MTLFSEKTRALEQAGRSMETQQGHKSWGKRFNPSYYLYVLPTFILLLVFMYYPSLSAIYHSFFIWDGATQAKFTGLGNFVRMWQDPVIRLAFLNVLKLTVWGVLVTTAAPLFTARLIFALRSRGAQFAFRVLFVIPAVVPQVVTWFVWAFIYDPLSGLANQTLQLLGLGALQQAWLGDPKIALYALMFMQFPYVFTLPLLIFTAGLQGISPELIDAASIDGAGGISRFFRVELPLLLGQVRLVVVLAILDAIQNFAYVLILTNGGPGNATMVPALALYRNAFTYNKMGYASAIGTIIFLLVIGLSYINLRSVRSELDYEA